MAIIGKINDKVLLDDCVLREEPEVLTRWIDPTIQEKDKEIERLNNIINEIEKALDDEINDYKGNIEIEKNTLSGEFLRGCAFEAHDLKKRLKILKEGK